MHSKKPEGPHLLGQFFRKRAFLPPGTHLRQDLFLGEPANGVAQQLLLVTEEKLDVEEVAGIGSIEGHVAHGTANGIGPARGGPARPRGSRRGWPVNRPGSSRSTPGGSRPDGR